jgi:hypothetical protein
MKVDYKVTGADRKAMVKVIEKASGLKAKYLFTPTYAFEIGPYMVSRYGVFSDSEAADPETTKKILEALTEEGYEGETTEDNTNTVADNEPHGDTQDEAAAPAETPAPAEEPAEEPQETPEKDVPEELQAPDTENATEPTAEQTGLSISLPLTSVDTEKLTKILESKGKLIKKALGTEATDFTVNGDKVTFTWFSSIPDADTADAATKLIAAIGKMSKNAKRITMTEADVESEKYAFRGFLIRLGFSGPEYKATRKCLLQNLSGASAFRNKEEADKFAARQKALRDAKKAEVQNDATN